MAREQALDHLGELQRAVLEAVWDLGKATVHDIRALLGQRKALAYTTVLSTLQKLERAGWLSHEANGRMHVYSAARSREEVHSSTLRRFTDGVFGGNALALFQHLIQEADLTREELAELRKMIDKRRKEVGHE